MKVILYMAISANGKIAKTNDDTSWILDGSWNSYVTTIKKAGNIIVGQRTYEIISRESPGEINDLNIAVLSHKGMTLLNSNHKLVNSPQQAIDIFRDSDEVIIIGGGHANTSFLKENLVDEIYFDIEPIILGEGISVFEGSDFEAKLEFLDQKKISNNEIQLHYKVLSRN
jgi:dihydrofolate reductase